MPAASPETLARHLVDDPDALAPETLARTGDALAAGLAEARARWPGLRLDDHEFAAFVGARVDRTRPLDEVVDELHLVDLALALACLHGEGPAILAFESAVRGTLREVFGGVTSRGSTRRTSSSASSSASSSPTASARRGSPTTPAAGRSAPG